MACSQGLLGVPFKIFEGNAWKREFSNSIDTANIMYACPHCARQRLGIFWRMEQISWGSSNL